MKRLLSETEWRNISTRKLELDTRARRRSAREVEMNSEFGKRNCVILGIIVASIILVWMVFNGFRNYTL